MRSFSLVTERDGQCAGTPPLCYLGGVRKQRVSLASSRPLPTCLPAERSPEPLNLAAACWQPVGEFHFRSQTKRGGEELASKVRQLAGLAARSAG